MATRSRRELSTAHPGQIINDLKQKRRTKEQIAADRVKAQKIQELKAQQQQEKKKKSVKRVAEAEDRLRKQDEDARATAARPDLVSAQLKRTVPTASSADLPTAVTKAAATAAAPSPSDSVAGVDESEDGVTMLSADDGDVEMEGEEENGDDTEQMGMAEDEAEVGDGDGDGDEEYVDSGADDQESDEQGGDESDTEKANLRAKIAALTKELESKKPKAKASSKAKAPRGALRSEIEAARAVVPSSVAKRKNFDDAEAPSAAKKPKAALGGLKTNWWKDAGLPKAVKKSSSSWNRSVSRASSVSATSATTHPSGISSPGVAIGEFDDDEDALSLAAAREAKGKKSKVSTTKMGITLKKTTVAVDVDGKVKKERKPKYKNADLPFPDNNRSADLKHFQKTVIPDLTDWAATLDDPFSAHTHPSFEPTVQAIWDKYFSAYPFNDAVTSVAAASLSNWRSDIGKRALKAVGDHLGTINKASARRAWVAEQTNNIAFIYRDPVNKTGGYRSELFLMTFGAHLRVVLKSDVSYGHPTGAASICAAALERALALYKDGSLSADDNKRRSRNPNTSFVAEPWAQRAGKYLPPIKALTLQKWQEIFSLAREYANVKGTDTTDILDLTDNTDGEGGESSDGYTDPRSRIVISDDEMEDDVDNDGFGIVKTVTVENAEDGEQGADGPCVAED